MRFSFVGPAVEGAFRPFFHFLRPALESRGHRWTPAADGADLVFNAFPAHRPRHFRRRSRAVFVVGVSDLPVREDMVDACYPTLIRSLSNVLMVLQTDGQELPDVHLMTLERGHVVVPGSDDPEAFGLQLYGRLEPLATSTLVVDNVFEPDLGPELWGGTEATRSIGRAGERLQAMGLLPAPFALEGVLSARDRAHLKKLFGLGGLSYGNLSARHDETRFWMSASGVDKARLRDVGHDILLVKDYRADSGAMILSVPPGITPRRVSVDAIEHWMIYRTHPRVGAILHVHGWIDGVEATEFNYPCGTYELGRAVADIVDAAPDPGRCVVGLKNHGLTITGPTLEDIFRRIEGRVDTVVPMS